MRLRLQFGGWLLGAGIGAAMIVPCAGEAQAANWAAQNQDKDKDRPPKPPKQESKPAQRQNQERRQAPPESRRPQPEAHRPQPEARRQQVEPRGMDRPNHARRENERPPAPNSANRENRPPNGRIEPQQRPEFNRDRPPAANRPTPNVRRFQDLSPDEKRSVLQNREKFNRLPPQRQQEIREAAQNWNRLTPEQQTHIKSDVLPKWQQMPADRRRAVRQRLGVLQNMPEYARNQHLSDPNFTRGMSEEDKAMLRDLSHMHVGAPDPPNE